jgi:phage protein D
MGHFAYVGGSTVLLSGWGAFDGLYFIERATHHVDKNGGYTTSLEIRIGG